MSTYDSKACVLTPTLLGAPTGATVRAQRVFGANVAGRGLLCCLSLVELMPNGGCCSYARLRKRTTAESDRTVPPSPRTLRCMFFSRLRRAYCPSSCVRGLSRIGRALVRCSRCDLGLGCLAARILAEESRTIYSPSAASQGGMRIPATRSHRSRYAARGSGQGRTCSGPGVPMNSMRVAPGSPNAAGPPICRSRVGLTVSPRRNRSQLPF